MPKIGQLTALKVARLSDPGLYLDGAGLYLQVSKTGTKSWLYCFTLHGRSREMGLGSLNDVSLAEAREKAAEARKLKQSGVDPIEARKAARDAARLAAASAIKFKDAAERYIAAHAPGWRNAKHAAQWRATLEQYAYPIFGNVPVQSIDTGLVTKALEPIWTTKTETASRVRGRIESILDWATARGYRRGDNPARWRGHLENLLPARAKVQKVQHHEALPYAEMAAFFAALREQQGTAARALEFTILTAARTSETIGATWDEIDFDDATWTVPAERIKGGREHRVPLSASALAVLRAQQKAQHEAGYKGQFVFPGDKPGRPLSNMAMLALLKRMDRDDLTVHGFRSTFRDWAAERTNYPREVAEAALAHVVGDKVEAAYRRGDLFEKRCRLMAEWAKFCTTPQKAGEVVPLSKRP